MYTESRTGLSWNLKTTHRRCIGSYKTFLCTLSLVYTDFLKSFWFPPPCRSMLILSLLKYEHNQEIHKLPLSLKFFFLFSLSAQDSSQVITWYFPLMSTYNIGSILRFLCHIELFSGKSDLIFSQRNNKKKKKGVLYLGLSKLAQYIFLSRGFSLNKITHIC